MADHFNEKVKQVGCEIEGTPGVAETLTAADFVLRPFVDAKYTPDRERFSNDEVGDDNGMSPDFVAGERGTVEVGFVLKNAGVSALTNPPAVGKFIRGCGYREQLVRTIAIGSVSGGDSAFLEGETFTAPGGKAGIIEEGTTGTTLRYILTAGTALADTDVVTVAADSDQATCSGASSNYAWRYTPRTTSQETLTLEYLVKNIQGTAAKDFLARLKGAMGTAQIEYPGKDVGKFRATYQGVIATEENGSFYTGVTYETVAPGSVGKFLNSVLQLNGVALVPGAFTVDLANQVVLDPDPTTSGGSAGYDYARVLSREPSIQIDPRRVPLDVFDDLDLHQQGTTFPFRFVSSGAAGHIIEISAPACQIRAWAPGEENFLSKAQLTLGCTRRSASRLADTELKIYFR